MMPAGHEVHVFYGLGGCAFEEVVEGADEDEALVVGGEVEAYVAEGAADGVLDLGEGRGLADADGGAVVEEVFVEGLDFVGRGGLVEADVDRGENAAGDGEEVGGELDLGSGEMELFEEFAGVAVVEDAVGGEVIGRVHEVGGGGRGFACAGDAGFAVGDDAAIEVGQVGAEERGEGEDDGGGIAAGVGDEAGSRYGGGV